MYKRNKRHLADMIINDKEEATTYQKLYESDSPLDDSHISSFKDTDIVYVPITKDELLRKLKSLKNKSPVTDNITVNDLRNISPETLLILFNCQLSCQKQLPCWKTNKTILIPKTKQNFNIASNWRPIIYASYTGFLQNVSLM